MNCVMTVRIGGPTETSNHLHVSVVVLTNFFFFLIINIRNIEICENENVSIFFLSIETNTKNCLYADVTHVQMKQSLIT